MRLLAFIVGAALAFVADAGGNVSGFEWVGQFTRYPGNPIIRPQGKWAADLVFNPAAIVKDGKVGLLCRAVNLTERPVGKCWSVSALIWAWSNDGYHFELEEEPFLHPDDTSPYGGGFEDPRLVYIEEKKLYVLTYTGVKYWKDEKGQDKWEAPGLIAWSRDLRNWEWGGEMFPSRAVCITPRKVAGRYWAYWDNGGLRTSWSDDLKVWHHTGHSPVLPRKGMFDSVLCEAVAAPIMTDRGVLLLYNGAMGGQQRRDYTARFSPIYGDGNFDVYQVGWVLFDGNDPEKVVDRCERPILSPVEPYERFGFVGYTCFASGLVQFNGKWMLYYGCCDNRIAVATAPVANNNK